MAIIFISPKKRQRMIFVSIVVLVAAAMGLIFLAVFFREIRNNFDVVLSDEISSVREVKLDFALVDSERVQALQPYAVQTEAPATTVKDDPFVPYYSLITPKK